MLPPIHQQCYQEFRQLLQHSDELVAQGSDGSALKSEILILQQFFQNQILILDTNVLSAELEQRVQSFQVEINKQLRLLNTDAMFLQVAKQAATTEQRRSQVRDRIATLMRYCEALLGEGERKEEVES